MAAAVMACRKRDVSILLDEPNSSLHGPISKRFRRFSEPSPAAEQPSVAEVPILRLREMFPDLDPQTLMETLEAFGNNLEPAIKRLKVQSVIEARSTSSESAASHLGSDNPGEEALPTNGPGWVDIFVREMASASSIDDARARASRVLELLKKSISASAKAEAASNFQNENEMLKEKAEALLHDNSVLRRGVAILHERQKDYDAKSQEVEHLKKEVSQYQERLHSLEVSNYTLAMHLRQSQTSSSIAGRSRPDVF